MTSHPDRTAVPLRLGILVSGAGTTLVAVDDAIRKGALAAQIALVATDRPGCPGAKRAEERGLPLAPLPAPKSLPSGTWDRELSEALARASVELVVLAGYLRVVPAEFLGRWEGRVINVHPSLLPKYGGPGMYGTHVHSAVLASGERETGATVHVVTPEVDRGPVVAQARWDVKMGETADELAERQKPREHELLIGVLRGFASGELPLPWRNVAPSRSGTGLEGNAPEG